MPGNGIEDAAYVLAIKLARGDFGGTGGTTTPQPLSVTYSGTTWSPNPTQVAAARLAGSSIVWQGTTVLPTAADGLANGDTVYGTFTQPAPTRPLAGISIPSGSVPVAVDSDGVSADVVRLTRVYGVSWVVNGVSYPSASMTGSTLDVPFTAGTSTTVLAQGESGFKVIDATKSWTLTFTNVIASPTNVTIDVAAYPTAVDNPGVLEDAVRLTSVTDVTWTVDGVDYPSSTFTGTRDVQWFTGAATTVTAKPSRDGVTLNGTTSWNLTFTNAGTVQTPLNVRTSSDLHLLPEGAVAASPLTGMMSADLGGAVKDLTHNGNAKLTGYTGGGAFYLNGYGPSVTFGDGWTGAARAVSLNVNSPQAGTKPNGARLGLMKSGANGVSLYFANADVRVETYGTAWTTLGTLSGGNTKSANWTLGYDPATSTVIVKRDRVTVWTGTYTYSGNTATAPWYAAESGSYSTVIDNIKVWGE